MNGSVLGHLVRDVAAIVRQAGDERETTQRVARALSRSLDEGLRLDARYTEAKPDHYVMYPLYVSPDKSFCLASAVWNIDQLTPVHDHGVWGVVGIYEGVEHEVRYTGPDLTRTRPLEAVASDDFGPGEVTICCTSDADVHQVSCGSRIPCVGIHVYGGDIGQVRRRQYDVDTGGASYFQTSWPLPPLLS